jgi:hypothetical protein
MFKFPLFFWFFSFGEAKEKNAGSDAIGRHAPWLETLNLNIFLVTLSKLAAILHYQTLVYEIFSPFFLNPSRKTPNIAV